MNTYSDRSLPIKSLELLTAITNGNANVDDLAEELEQQGLPFSYLKLRNKTSREIISQNVQKVPKVPFILNGTMYDPKDITRFNGQELHFVKPPSGDHLLVVDNEGLLKSWLRLAHHELLGYNTMRQTVGVQAWPSSLHPSLIQYATQPQPGTPAVGVQTHPGAFINPYLQHYLSQPQQPGGTPAVGPLFVPAGPIGPGQPGGPTPIVGGGHSPAPPKTYFYEHINFQGSRLELNPNRGYWDLTKVRMGIFGNWNDEISSVALRGTRVAVLHEHINMTGQSLTLFTDNTNLHNDGWGDRASSVETW
ncbi:peptidase inhibitor family I36 protein [Desertibacillus haloalkaliphilus]|uniref:peptidase inhibitor family I36 protein n=1 Tax=Desertibacillus haloalkaliphilus TaxID=1328930 RepID=UPI001C25E751|nr:peptidase inhibitor family I36 protein [Desertibacillus haloalkaliphilus]